MKSGSSDIPPRSPRMLEDERQLAERAAEWLSVLETAGAAERAEFAKWIIASPRHAEEFLLITALSEELRTIPLEDFPQVRAQLAKSTANIVTLSSAPNSADSTRTALLRAGGAPFAGMMGRKRSARLIAAALGTAALLAIGTWIGILIRSPVFTTAVGEQRTVTLTDGSSVVLNTQSRVQVHFTARYRDIRLLRGEALFIVRHDAARPFRVTTDTALVQAVGTRFDVYRRDRETTVSVVEGRVGIASTNSTGVLGPQPATSDSATSGPTATSSRDATSGTSAETSVATQTALDAGEVASIAADGHIVKRIAPDGATRSVAWRQHRLIFLSDTLAEIAAEVNRYNEAPRIVIQGAATQRRYSGVFDSNDPQSLIDFLRTDPELTIETRSEKVIVHEGEPANSPLR